MVSKKLRLVFVALVSLGMISVIGMAIENSLAEQSINVIDQNQVDDEISRTITINIEDGISSSDDIR